MEKAAARPPRRRLGRPGPGLCLLRLGAAAAARSACSAAAALCPVAVRRRVRGWRGGRLRGPPRLAVVVVVVVVVVQHDNVFSWRRGAACGTALRHGRQRGEQRRSGRKAREKEEMDLGWSLPFFFLFAANCTPKRCHHQQTQPRSVSHSIAPIPAAWPQAEARGAEGRSGTSAFSNFAAEKRKTNHFCGSPSCDLLLSRLPRPGRPGGGAGGEPGPRRPSDRDLMRAGGRGIKGPPSTPLALS